MPYSLDDSLIFPHPSLADDDGLLAVGGDLSPERLLLAYQHGIFPWFSDDSTILWYAPHERFVLDPKKLITSKSMKQFNRQTKWYNAHDKAFKTVIQKCASIKRKDQKGTWITTNMQKAYGRLHELGYAHSIETYNDKNELVGGLYGVQIGRVFCGESMFSEQPNASKLALAYLCHQFDFDLIDCQIYSDHLASLGASCVPAMTYYDVLQKQEVVPFAI